MNKTVVVIGGGAAGMMAACEAAKKAHVILLEKNDKLGKKLYITGKGRCNLTNASEPDELIENTPSNPYFMYSSYYTFGSEKTMAFFESLGVKLKVERGKRVFPVSEKASDIVKALERELRKSGVDIRLGTPAKRLVTAGTDQHKKIVGVEIGKGETIKCDAVIVATGGLSYPMTGSTGDGYKFSKELGHTVTKLYPSLVPLKAKEPWVTALQGLSLKNVSIVVRQAQTVVYKDFGEMLFTHFGVSGPMILSASRFLGDQYAKNPTLTIDLKPKLNEKELDIRLLRDFEKYNNKDFRNALDDLLPQKMIPVMIELSAIDPFKKVHDVTKEERKTLGHLLKNLTLTIIDSTGFSEAVITCGGVCVDEIDPSTMQSKLVSGLYFAGEVIDVDCYTGGFNLQAAFSTAYLAGNIER